MSSQKFRDAITAAPSSPSKDALRAAQERLRSFARQTIGGFLATHMRTPSHSGPLVSLGSPKPGHKTFIFKGDEATVELIADGPWAGIVERRELLSEGHTRTFELGYGNIHGGVDHGDPRYVAQKFLALKIAHALFPESFIDPTELRYTRGEDGLVAVQYSPYVSDETGVIGTKRAFMEEYYRRMGEGERETLQIFLETSNQTVYAGHPGLEERVKQIQNHGIGIPHPTANFHRSGGEYVFFEVQWLAGHHTLPELLERGGFGALCTLSMIYALKSMSLRKCGLEEAYIDMVFDLVEWLASRPASVGDLFTITYAADVDHSTLRSTLSTRGIEEIRNVRRKIRNVALIHFTNTFSEEVVELLEGNDTTKAT